VTPAVDVDLSRVPRDTLFLGPTFRNMLLTAVEPAFFAYEDCSLPTPRGCFGEVQLQRWRVCDRQPLMYGGGNGRFPPFVPDYSWRRGALLADYGGDAHTDVHTGADTVAVFGPSRRGVAPAVVDALRPVGGPTRVRLPAPRFPAGVMSHVRQVRSAYHRLHTVRRVERALGLTHERVVQSLALGRALRGHRVGPPVRC
jgi:hypothetical protein